MLISASSTIPILPKILPKTIPQFQLYPETLKIIADSMRPKETSEKGFLNLTESLVEVDQKDRMILTKLGITYNKIVERLRGFLQRANQIKYKMDIQKINQKSIDQDDHDHDYNNCHNEVIPLFGGRQKPKDPVIIHETNPECDYMIQTISYKGYQFCPFGSQEKEKEKSKSKINANNNDDDELLQCNEHDDTDVMITNLKTKEYVTFPRLMVHLIEEHEFFEGSTPYRLDPEQVVRILNISNNIDYAVPYISRPHWTFEAMTSLPKGLMSKDISWFDIDNSIGLKGFISHRRDYTKDTKDTKDKKEKEEENESKNNKYLHLAMFEFVTPISKDSINDDIDEDDGIDDCDRSIRHGMRPFQNGEIHQQIEIEKCPIVLYLSTLSSSWISYARYKKKMIREFIIS